MKKKSSVLALGVTMLLMVSACGSNAVEPEKPVPPVQTVQAEQMKSEPLAKTAEEKSEMSQEELETIFENVYSTASENHPEDWNVDFQITDEIGKINNAIPDDKKPPSNLRTMYIDWRAAKVDKNPATSDEETVSVDPFTFSDCNEVVYATSQVNMRTGPGTNYDKVGALSSGNSAVRTGIGYNSCDGWSRIQLSDGSTVYVSSNYLSTTKSVQQQQQSSTPTGSNGGSSSQQTTTTGTPSSNSNLANSGLDFGGVEVFHPNEGKTQEQIDQEVQEMLERDKDYHMQ